LEDPSARRFAIRAAIVAALVAFLPYLYGLLAAPPGSALLGVPIAADDNMVYAAWMRQAMDGRFLFDNRFTLDAQPGLTIHFYFWFLGILAKGLGITLALSAARIVFSGLFVWAVYQLIRRVTTDNYVQKLGLIVTVIGGGLGFLVWHHFGIAHTKGSPLAPLTQGRLPVDVWQTEAFVFPSMLENGLFMASLCLIIAVFIAVLDSRESWRPVPYGVLAMAVLMNIHSYDVLLITFVLVAFLVVSAASRLVTGAWVARAAVIGLGAVPSALWFMYVLRQDTVFQTRAATETYSPNFQTVLMGFSVLIVLALIGLLQTKTDGRDDLTGKPASDRYRQMAVWATVILMVAAYGLALRHAEGYWMGALAFGVGFGLVIAIATQLRTGHPGHDLILCWALVGLLAPYFPALFQRKLAMGLAVPWAILATLGFGWLLGQRERGVRNLGVAFGMALLGATSLQWFARDLTLIRANVSNTTVHPMYLSPNVQQILEALDRQDGRKTVIAMPGIPRPIEVDRYDTPYLPDLNAILSGLTGAYTYAGHWSETPNYNQRRGDATMLFLVPDLEARRAFLQQAGIEYVVAPVPEAFPQIEELTQGRSISDMRDLGETLVDGPQFRLIRVGR
jgi:arabinosyltransferase C